jgi:glucosamine-phosphate N-acetyltransferase
MALIIRPLEVRDFEHGFMEALNSLAPVDLTPAEAVAIWRQRTADGIFTVVADLEGDVVGTASLLIERKFIHRGGRVGHIEDVAVRSDSWGKGVGSELVRHLTHIASGKGCYKVILNCHDHMVAFYGKLGFRRHDSGLRFDCERSATPK